MKGLLCFAVLLWALVLPVRAAEVPKELKKALPEGAEALLEGVDVSGVEGFSAGLLQIGKQLSGKVTGVVRRQVKGAVSMLLVVLLCSAVDAFSGAAGAGNGLFLSVAGALSVSLLTAGSLESFIGLGVQTIEDLQVFSHVLLPTLATAAAASGSVTAAAFQQVTTVFLVDLLLNLVNGLLIPLTYLYIGTLTAAACLPDNPLSALADGLKKGITWILTTVLLLFTLYLSVARVISGSTDAAAVRIAKTAISGAVPVVGGIIAEASETVLAGAGLLKNTIGVFGMLAILAACAYPFLQLGVQYLLYKLTAFLAAVVGAPSLCRLINGLGGAFGLVLGMTGACALLLLISVLSSVAAVAI